MQTLKGMVSGKSSSSGSYSLCGSNPNVTEEDLKNKTPTEKSKSLPEKSESKEEKSKSSPIRNKDQLAAKVMVSDDII